MQETLLDLRLLPLLPGQPSKLILFTKIETHLNKWQQGISFYMSQKYQSSKQILSGHYWMIAFLRPLDFLPNIHNL